MKKYFIPFTTLLLTLTVIPGMAAPNVNLTTDRAIEEASKVAGKIDASTQKLKLGGTITLPTSIADYQQVKTAIAQWESKCKEIVINAGGSEEYINTQGSNEKTKKQSCFIKTCDETRGYKTQPAIDRMSCQKTSAQKKADKGEAETARQTDNKKMEEKCRYKKGDWNNILKKCYCGVKEQSLDDNAATCTKGQEKEDNAAEKAACEAAKESGAKWSINKCECTDKTKNWSKNDKTCVLKTGECKINNGKGKYDDQGVCKVESCNDKYVGNNDKTKCNKNEQNKEAKAQTQLEKQYEKDIDELIKTHEAVVQKFIKDCTSKGKDIENGECEQ